MTGLPRRLLRTEEPAQSKLAPIALTADSVGEPQQRCLTERRQQNLHLTGLRVHPFTRAPLVGFTRQILGGHRHPQPTSDRKQDDGRYRIIPAFLYLSCPRKQGRECSLILPYRRNQPGSWARTGTIVRTVRRDGRRCARRGGQDREALSYRNPGSRPDLGQPSRYSSTAAYEGQGSRFFTAVPSTISPLR
jgi:hypothetical protein